MNGRNFKKLLADGRIDRRRFNRLLASMGLAMTAMPLVARPTVAADNLTTLSWSIYHLPELQKPFVEKYGRQPDVQYMADLDEGLTKARSGAALDTAHLDIDQVKRWRDADLLRPIDTSRLSHWGELFDEVKALPGVSDGGQTWFVPCNWGNISILYRTDQVDAEYLESPTWNILWDERYKGRLSLRDDIQTAAVVTGLVLGVSDPWGMSDDEIAQVKDKLREQRPLQRFYWTDNVSMEQAMAGGEIVAATGWNSSYTLLRRQGIPVGYMVPKEGILVWVDGVSWVKTGQGPEQQLYDFLDAWLSPETGKYILEQLSFGHANRHSYELADRKALEDANMTDPIKLLESGLALRPIESTRMEKYTAMFTEVKAGF